MLRSRPRLRRIPWLLAAAVLLYPALASAAGSDPVADLVLELALLLAGAVLAGHVATRFGQPAVLGELLLGVAVAQLDLPWVAAVRDSPNISLLGQLGALLLLFEVGLSSTVSGMLAVGKLAVVVACVGVAGPFALGWAIAKGFVAGPGVSAITLFLGATLTATSVGITARVFQDLGALHRTEAKIILGAAVVDDVLGLVILAVVVAAIQDPAGLQPGPMALIVGKAALFLVLSLAAGVWATPRLFRWATRLRHPSSLLACGLATCFVMSWAADQAGLAPIVGAFAAGLVLEDVHSEPYRARGELGLEQLVRPLASLLVPVFFVQMGLRTDLRSLAQPGALGLGTALLAAAIVGKQACALAIWGKGSDGKPLDRWLVGLGMIPRGEVGLIFAGVGARLQVDGRPVVDAAAYAAVVLMVVATTVLTPPLLQWRLGRTGRANAAESEPEEPVDVRGDQQP